MKLPTEQQCQDYFKKYLVPINILAHCRKVREFADFLALKFSEAGIPVNKEFVSRLALMHDLFKMAAIDDLKPNKFHQRNFSAEEIAMREELRRKYPGRHEGEIAYQIFKDDFPELALSIKEYNQQSKEKHSWEELIVHYADWRTFRNEIISLPERLAYLKEHYPGHDRWWEERWIKVRKIEEKIVSIINLQPEEMKVENENRTKIRD